MPSGKSPSPLRSVQVAAAYCGSRRWTKNQTTPSGPTLHRRQPHVAKHICKPYNGNQYSTNDSGWCMEKNCQLLQDQLLNGFSRWSIDYREVVATRTLKVGNVRCAIAVKLQHYTYWNTEGKRKDGLPKQGHLWMVVVTLMVFFPVTGYVSFHLMAHVGRPDIDLRIEVKAPQERRWEDFWSSWLESGPKNKACLITSKCNINGAFPRSEHCGVHILF